MNNLLNEFKNAAGLYLLQDNTAIKVDAVTSDTHVGHKNIAKYSGRPFDNSESTDAMDDHLINQWNKVVSENETVLHLGDVAMGLLSNTVPLYGKMNGHKLLIPGNHDLVSSVRGKKNKNESLKAEYPKVFDILPEQGVRLAAVCGDSVIYGYASHYPPSFAESLVDNKDSFSHLRPEEPSENEFLLHGHTHSHEIFEFGKKNIIHVGVDAHNLAPVRAEDIVKMVFND